MASMQARAPFRVSSRLAEGGRRRRREVVVRAGFRTQVGLGDSSLPLQSIHVSPAITVERLKKETKDLPAGKPAQGISSATGADDLLTWKLYAVMETAADRAEMHDIIGTQRNDWNLLLLNSVNSMTLAASISAGLSSIPLGSDLAFLKISSAVLYSAATLMLLAMNKIQPSQLAEEQRNAARLFRQLERKIRTALALGTPTPADVDDALNRVLALDKAYPLSLFPGMLEKFPEKVQPTVWWPQPNRPNRSRSGRSSSRTAKNAAKDNGWSQELEDVSAGVLQTLKKSDTAEYLTNGDIVVKINKVLAMSGPALTGMAAVGASVMDSAPALGPLPVFMAVVGGALATAVNTLEHGAQVGMIFEMFRNCGGYYRHLEEEIELNLGEQEVEERENGEMFELKMALHLGRSLSDLRSLSSSARKVRVDGEVHAGKLF